MRANKELEALRAALDESDWDVCGQGTRRDGLFFISDDPPPPELKTRLKRFGKRVTWGETNEPWASCSRHVLYFKCKLPRR